MRPRYRASYVFIQRKHHEWASRRGREDRFHAGVCAQTMLEKIGLYREHFNYMHSLKLQDKRNRFTRIPAGRRANEVADTAPAADTSASEVARYAKVSGNISDRYCTTTSARTARRCLTTSTSRSACAKKTRSCSRLSMAALHKAKPKIEEILKDEGIPLVTGLPRS